VLWKFYGVNATVEESVKKKDILSHYAIKAYEGVDA
jgi:hypothetical protein